MIAITREISPNIGACELTHLDRTTIDLERAAAQHRAYQSVLEELGCEVVTIEQDPDLPDVFIEDTALVLPEIAVLTRPGAASRRDEVVAVARALGGMRPLAEIRAPATLMAATSFGSAGPSGRDRPAKRCPWSPPA